MKCKYCEQMAQETVPPLCEKHLDLALLADYLIDRGEAVTVESVTALVEQCLANRGTLSLTAADVPGLLAGPFAVDVRIA
jgi:hypothetical protein